MGINNSIISIGSESFYFLLPKELPDNSVLMSPLEQRYKIIKTIQSIIENDIDKNKYSYKECVNKLEDEIETEKFFINYNHKNIVVTDINHAKVENFDHLIVCSMSNKNYPKNSGSSFFYNSTIFNDFSLKYENEYNLKDFLQLLKRKT